jgi:hypothetical protein
MTDIFTTIAPTLSAQTKILVHQTDQTRPLITYGYHNLCGMSITSIYDSRSWGSWFYQVLNKLNDRINKNNQLTVFVDLYRCLLWWRKSWQVPHFEDLLTRIVASDSLKIVDNREKITDRGSWFVFLEVDVEIVDKFSWCVHADEGTRRPGRRPSIVSHSRPLFCHFWKQNVAPHISKRTFINHIRHWIA